MFSLSSFAGEVFTKYTVLRFSFCSRLVLCVVCTGKTVQGVRHVKHSALGLQRLAQLTGMMLPGVQQRSAPVKQALNYNTHRPQVLAVAVHQQPLRALILQEAGERRPAQQQSSKRGRQQP